MATYVYTETESWFHVVDVSTITNPFIAGSYYRWDMTLQGFYPRGRYVYCIESGAYNSLIVFDVSNPSVPIVVGEISGAGPPNYLDKPYDLFVRFPYAYIVSFADNALTIFDISNPTAPIHVGAISGAGFPNYLNGAYHLWVSGDYAYVVSWHGNALTIFDISNPAAPFHVGYIGGFGGPNWLGQANDVQVVGNLAYVASYGDDALTIFNISNPAAPFHVGVVRGLANWLFHARNVVVRGNYAYVAASGLSSLTVIDITNPALPVHAAHIAGPGLPNYLFSAHDVRLQPGENYAYVTAPDDSALTIIDIANPLAPLHVASLTGLVPPLTTHSIDSQPLGTAPTVTTNPATVLSENITSLNGTLDDDGDDYCDCGFQWGQTVELGHTTPTELKGITPATFSYMLGGLYPNTTYYFRAFATNIYGTGYGAVLSFTTSVADGTISPSVLTLPATLITEHTARINGMVAEDAGHWGYVRFQWGGTREYGTNTPWMGGYVKGDEFFANLSELAEGAGYHFRAQFKNSAGIASGRDMVFNTLVPLGPVTLIPEDLAYLLEAS